MFNRECRYCSKSWRVLGYIPDLEMKSSAYKSKTRLGLVGKGHPCYNYHACLSRIVQSFKKFQGKDEPIKEWICIADYVAFRRFFPVAFIIGDSQSQDMCGSYLAYANVPRMCRACDVQPKQIDNPYHVCKFLSMPDINTKCRVALGIYKPEEYGLGTELDGLTEYDIKELKVEAHNSLKNYPSICTSMLSMIFGWVPIPMDYWRVCHMT